MTDRDVTFALQDGDHALSSVKLCQEITRPRVGPAFERVDATGTWRLRFPRPNADRMEYLFRVEHKDGGSETIPDPANPERAPGPFGEKSVVDFPGYRAPAWTEAARELHGNEIVSHIRARSLRVDLPLIVWTSPGAAEDDALPLLVAHDGPEYADFSDLLKFLDLFTRSGALPPMRAALVGPVERGHIYSASTSYARALAYEIVPAIERMAPMPHGRSKRVGMGASLGALAMLHAHRTHPAVFGGLFLQSGSYFRQRFDKQESGFVRFRRISRFAGRVLSASDWAHPIPIAMTCGSVEENMANNRAMRDALSTQGYDVVWRENRDGHNWIAWRDTFEQDLLALLQRVWV
ncbi:MAG: alpha/beta hydrolase [Actinomycetota bacterium]